MNVASKPCLRATPLTARFMRRQWSAASRPFGRWRKLISYCPTPYSEIEVAAGIPCASKVLAMSAKTDSKASSSATPYTLRSASLRPVAGERAGTGRP